MHDKLSKVLTTSLPIKIFQIVSLLLVSSELLASSDTKPLANSEGSALTYSTAGSISHKNEFFQDLGSNKRVCASCHRPEEGWSVAPVGIKKRFKKTSGTDPIFRLNDGSNSPNADVSSKTLRAAAYSQLLEKGLFRVGLKVAKNAEFELIEALDPYRFVSLDSDTPELSLFRRPLPTTNLKFLSSVMWDGRESVAEQDIAADLQTQANSATTGHAQGEPLSIIQRQHIVEFETSLFTTQVFDKAAKSLASSGAKALPKALTTQVFTLGINSPYLNGAVNPAFNPRIFDIFDAWNQRPDKNGNDARASVARGQEIFNSRTFKIKEVSGLNDDALFGNASEIIGTCGTCHNTPNVGSSSTALFLNTGISDESRRTYDLPLYRLRNKTSGKGVSTTDPGRALVTGLWKDIGKFKVPALRALAARPPYFHNGQASELANVVDFYESRFGLGLNNRERLDLINFLGAL
ncbi:MAG: hypothetical protein ABL919_14060 [Methylococcales bacterium]|nr:hypothetical protein [Methylococcaceae bacterium]